MRTSSILALSIAALVVAPRLYAQTPATTGAGVGVGAATAPASTSAPGATPTAAAPAAKAKPLSSSDARNLTQIMEMLQFNIRMGEIARHRDKEDKELVTFANTNHKAVTGQWTPLVNMAMERGVDVKNIPTAVSTADKNDIAKLGKVKAEKWKLEYFELLAKNGKRYARAAENAAKSINDPQAKEAATAAVALIASQASDAEAKHKEMKEKK